MRLTKHSDYALRVLVYVAAAEGRQVSTEQIATSYSISTHHLVKVVGTLGRAGFLTVRRGRSGGFVLAREPSEIRIGEVVAATEPDFALNSRIAPLSSRYARYWIRRSMLSARSWPGPIS